MPEAIQVLLDFILHVDVHLQTFVQTYGAWVYALLFLIIFVETGVVVMPFLPGDSLLFVVGTLCGVGLMNLPLSIALLCAAAVLGNQTNYHIGRFFGPRVFQWEQSRFFNKRAFEQAHAFYETLRRRDAGARAIHAVHSHLCAVRGRGGIDDAAPIHVLRRQRRHPLGGQPRGRGLFVRQHTAGA